MSAQAHPKIESFWSAVPDNATLGEMADGMDIAFVHEGKTYRINTKVLERPRIHPIEKYYEALDAAALNAKEIS